MSDARAHAAERVRCKMFVQEVRHTQYGGGVTLRVVTRGEDNKEWAAATPSGEITLSIKNDLAVGMFRDLLGQDVYVDIYPVPGEQQGQEGMA